MQKPYIELDQDFPGIVSLFMYDQESAKALSAMGQIIMRRTRSLSVGERELIASFVSKLNGCNFCCESHTACAQEFLDPQLVSDLIDNRSMDQLTSRMRALLAVAVLIQRLDRERLPYAIENAKVKGATDEEIHDTVLVTAFFSMCNRYVDGLGTTYQAGEPEEGGKSLARYGYTMGIQRFFREVLPKLWSRFWG